MKKTMLTAGLAAFALTAAACGGGTDSDWEAQVAEAALADMTQEEIDEACMGFASMGVTDADEAVNLAIDLGGEFGSEVTDPDALAVDKASELDFGDVTFPANVTVRDALAVGVNALFASCDLEAAQADMQADLVEAFADSASETNLDTDDLVEPSTYGDDPYLDSLQDDALAGDIDAAHELYANSPVGSDYESVALKLMAADTGETSGTTESAELTDLERCLSFGDGLACEAVMETAPERSDEWFQARETIDMIEDSCTAGNDVACEEVALMESN